MDDKLNNNLEAFFANSMERFDDVPSDMVWDTIEEKLDRKEKNKPFFLRWKFLSSFLILSLFVAGFTWVQINSNQDIKSITNQISHFENENASPSKERESEIKSDVIRNNLAKENDQNNLKSQTESSSIPSSKVPKNASKTISAIIKNPYKRENSLLNNSIKVQNPSSATEINTNSRGVINLDKEKIEHVKNDIASSQAINTRRGIEEKKSKNMKVSTLSNNTELGKINLLETKNHLLTINENRISQLIMGDPIIVIKPNNRSMSKYRIGLNTRFANTFIKYNSDFNGTESYGIRQEYVINNHWAITNSINFNVQHYDIIPKSGVIEKAVVREYTDRDFNDIGIREIDVNAEYIDIPLGIKWNSKETRSGWSYFMNPSVVWQIYLPQMFSFTQADNDVTVRNDSRIIASLGSSSLDIGMEKKIGNYFYLQFSFWGEHSFIPLGTQKDKIKLCGIRTSLLFGK